MSISREEASNCLRSKFPDLELGDYLGSGATADVYALRGAAPPQVIKFIDTRSLPDPNHMLKRRNAMREYFLNEAKTMEILRDCPYIMHIFDWTELPRTEKLPNGQTADYAIFMLRLRRMEHLKDHLMTVGMSEKTLIRMAMDICLALQECEDHKILHRDVKPHNIFTIRTTNGYRYVLGDFGFCRKFEQVDLDHLTMCGTLAFQAPEILDRRIREDTYNSDIYSLGATLYYLACNEPPCKFAGFREHADKHLVRLSGEFKEIICQAVDPDPQKRQQHGREMYQQLKTLLPRASTKIITDNYFVVTKQAMLDGKYNVAIQCAINGVRSGEQECKRLLAYCLYNEARMLARCPDLSDMEIVRMNTYQKRAEQILDNLVFDGDIMALTIRSWIAYDQNDIATFLKDSVEAAEGGSIPAIYIYGRLLYYGELSITADRDRGFAYILKAAEQNYLDARRVLKRIASQEPWRRVPRELIDGLDEKDVTSTRRQANRVEFL